MIRELACCLGMLLVTAVGAAESPGRSPHRAVDEDWMVKHDFAGFLSAHPDLYHHRIGAQHYRDGDYAAAMRHFRKSARYADKPSQAMLAEMFWNGHGVAVDRATAYAWMDLAAERGYPQLLVARERFWAALDEGERTRALQVGERLYDEFGDAVAQKRIAAALRRGQRNAAGSRTGFRANATILAMPPGTHSIPRSDQGDHTATALAAVNSRDYYADTYWKADSYFAWRALQWQEQLGGQATVGPLRSEAVEAGTPAPAVPPAGSDDDGDRPPPRGS